MEDNLEIYFCEICSESVPAVDLDTGDATKVKGKVIGPCCLADVRGPVDAGSSSLSPVSLTALGAIVLVAIAAATLHLQSQFSEDIRLVSERVDGVATKVAAGSVDSWAGMEKRLDATMEKWDLQPALDRIEKLESKITVGQDAVRSEVRGVTARFAGVEATQKVIVDGQGQLGREIKDVENEILRLERDVAAAAAAPRMVKGDTRIDDAAVDMKEPVKDDGLTKALRHQVSRLKDDDDGNRFEAVDALVMSENKAVLDHLIPMLKDPDVFVRRLTAEGLSKFKDKRSVSALIVAMADPESIVRYTSHVSLKKLTGQSLAFDPDGTSKSRSQSQRRWQDWWKKAAASF